MKLLPLVEVRARLLPGQPLPWNVRDEQGRLLLARGHPLSGAAMVQALLERGVFVAEHEAAAAPVEVPLQDLRSPFARWDRLCAHLAEVLGSPGERHFLQRVQQAAWHVRGLHEFNADLLLFLILRHDHGRFFEAYGTSHALHVACICSLLAQRLDWDGYDLERVIGAALTMNLSIIDLQSRLACQSAPLTDAQREQIHRHPHQASLMLRAAGLDDEAWLAAVEDHHERRGGGGYPGSRAEPSAMSQLLRLSDQFTAKHSARAMRPALPAQVAARQLFLENPDEPLAAMLIKAFGIYPPGCFVRLASGELAIVVRRGRSANTPQVAAVTNARGEALSSPQPRDSSQRRHAIVASIAEPAGRLRVPPQAFYPELAAA